MAIPELILASTSPRRRELLEQSGYRFRIESPSADAECGVCSGETPPELVARLAWQKARDVAQRLSQTEQSDGTAAPRALIIACDTVAQCVGQVLGKPRDADDARWMLRLLRGREHAVYSGLCIWPLPWGEPPLRQPTVGAARTTLQMQPLDEPAIDAYLATGLWEGKAGGFGYQDGNQWLRVVEGSESNVVGLPLELLAQMLGEHDYRPGE